MTTAKEPANKREPWNTKSFGLFQTISSMGWFGLGILHGKSLISTGLMFVSGLVFMFVLYMWRLFLQDCLWHHGRRYEEEE